MDKKIDFAAIEHKDVYASIQAFEPELEDDEFQRDRQDPGHRFAFKYGDKEKSKSPSASKQNGYVVFVEEQIAAAGRSRVIPPDFDRYATKWKSLDQRTRDLYKAKAKDVEEQSDEDVEHCAEDDYPESLREHEDKVESWNYQRLKYGSDSLPDYDFIGCFYPPDAPELERLIGREEPEDLEVIRGLYLINAVKECDQGEKFLVEITSRYTAADFARTPICIVSSIPVSSNPNPFEAVAAPLEIFLASFTLENGISDVGYHTFIKAGIELFSKDGQEMQPDDQRLAKYIDSTKAARLNAWKQAHFIHNIPYEGFMVLDDSPEVTIELASEVDRLFDGWNIHASRVIQFSENYYEIYTTIVETLREVQPEGQPAVFVGLQDLELFEESLEWLRDKATEQATHNRLPTDIVAVKPIVLPLEYLIWHIFRSLDIEIAEGDIEKALGSRDYQDDVELRCGYHAQRPDHIHCARSQAMLYMLNTFDLVLPECGIPFTSGHGPLLGENDAWDSDCDTSTYVGSDSTL